MGYLESEQGWRESAQLKVPGGSDLSGKSQHQRTTGFWTVSLMLVCTARAVLSSLIFHPRTRSGKARCFKSALGPLCVITLLLNCARGAGEGHYAVLTESWAAGQARCKWEPSREDSCAGVANCCPRNSLMSWGLFLVSLPRFPRSFVAHPLNQST